MLNQEFVSALLQASITGAGLVLAVYTLIIPWSRKIFGYRAEEIFDRLKTLKTLVSTTETQVSAEKLGILKQLIEDIQEQRGFPSYLSWGVGLTFLGYAVTTLMSWHWLLGYQTDPTFDYWLPAIFFWTTVIFLIVGLLSIHDISRTMKREFEDFKKKVEKAKSKAEQEA